MAQSTNGSQERRIFLPTFYVNYNIGRPAIYIICELYIDDILLYAKTQKDFLDRLRTILQRFRTFNIKLQPKKCRLGLQEIEYVGHKINKDGMIFSREKLDGVMAFEKPIYVKQLKQFMSLANYFKDNIRGFSSTMGPLNEYMKGYDKHKSTKILWSELATDAYNQIKLAINNCPTLYFW